MKKKYKIGFWILTIITIINIAFVIHFSTQIDTKYSIPLEKDCKISKGVDLTKELNHVTKDNLSEKFPYEKFLNNGSYCSVNQIIEEINEMNKVQSDSIVNQIVLSEALTNKLYEKWEPNNKFNLDKIYEKIQWIEKFNQYKEVNENYRTFFNVIYKFWLNKISINLSQMYDENNDVKYKLKFKTLANICESKKFHVNVGKTSIEKVIDNFKESKYAYLINRITLETPIFVQIAILLILILTLFSYYLLITKCFNYIKKKSLKNKS